MRRVILALATMAATAVLANGANAADLGGRYQPPPAVKAPIYNPAFTWTGFYVGINGGGAWGRSTWDSADTFNVSGGLVGGTAGFNWQIGQAVLGVEGDIDWTNISGTTNTLCGVGCKTSNTWLGTVRGRLGYAFDRFLPYITGGVAFGDIRASVPGFAGASATNAGWTLGGGLEYAFAPNWSIKGEYLYANLGSFNCGLSCGATAVDNVSLRTNIFRAGVNFRF
jgi:outer membrane immunogenic protein